MCPGGSLGKVRSIALPPPHIHHTLVQSKEEHIRQRTYLPRTSPKRRSRKFG